MKPLIVYYDLETSGLPGKPSEGLTPGILQIAMLFEVDGIVVGELDLMVDCDAYNRHVSVSPEALKINGIEVQYIKSFTPPLEVITEIQDKIRCFRPNDKAPVLIGYNNSSFDKFFLEDLFDQVDQKIGDTFSYKQRDVFELVKEYHAQGWLFTPFNQKLVTLLDAYKLYTLREIEEGAHNALWDCVATRALHRYITKTMIEFHVNTPHEIKDV